MGLRFDMQDPYDIVSTGYAMALVVAVWCWVVGVSYRLGCALCMDAAARVGLRSALDRQSDRRDRRRARAAMINLVTRDHDVVSMVSEAREATASATVVKKQE